MSGALEIDSDQRSHEWVHGTVVKVLEQSIFEGKKCTRVLQVNLPTKQSDILIPSLSRRIDEPSISGEFCVSNNVRRIDPIQQSLKSTSSDSSWHMIYNMLKNMMPYQTSQLWKEKINIGELKAKDFTFNAMFDHISKGKEHSFVDVMETIRSSDIHKNVINSAAGADNANEDILNVISYLCGMIVAMEIDGLRSPEGTCT